MKDIDRFTKIGNWESATISATMLVKFRMTLSWFVLCDHRRNVSSKHETVAKPGAHGWSIIDVRLTISVSSHMDQQFPHTHHQCIEVGLVGRNQLKSHTSHFIHKSSSDSNCPFDTLGFILEACQQVGFASWSDGSTDFVDVHKSVLIDARANLGAQLIHLSLQHSIVQLYELHGDQDPFRIGIARRELHLPLFKSFMVEISPAFIMQVDIGVQLTSFLQTPSAVDMWYATRLR